MIYWAASQEILQYAKDNWFKIFLISFVLYVFLSKDFSFSVNLNNPEPGPTPGVRMEAPDKREKKKEVLLTQKQVKPQKNESSFFDRIRLPFIGREKAPLIKSELASIEESTKMAYLKRFAHVAQNEQKKFGIPASITLANALLHSFAGQRDMSLKGNNHFALPCTSSWQGDSGTYSDACYRHYESAWSSFRDHSVYLNEGKFAHLKKLNVTDYKGWARGLEKAGFSDFSSLAKSLIRIIEDYQLNQFDKV